MTPTRPPTPRAAVRTVPLPPQSDLHAPRPPARTVRPAARGATAPAGAQSSAPTYRCRSGQHLWPDARDARRCCNGFVRVTVADALRGIYDRWERDTACWHDATYTPTRVDPLDPADADTRTDLVACAGVGAGEVGPC